MEDNVIGIEDLDTPIYRIFSSQWFDHLLTKQQNGLVRPGMWDDPFENFFLKNDAVTRDGELVSLESIASSWYGQCWTLNKDSDAMWRIYSDKNKSGVRVRTTVRALFSTIYDRSDKFSDLKFLIGAVNYIDRNDIETMLRTTSFGDVAFGGRPHGFAKTLLTKRPEFSHENEVRILFHDAEGKHANAPVVNFAFPWQKILSEVALDPRLSENEYVTMRNRLIGMGCTIPIGQSDLYKFTPIPIRLG